MNRMDYRYEQIGKALSEDWDFVRQDILAFADCTHHGTGGATLGDLRLMRKHSPASVRVKAAGGARSLDSLREFRAVGVARAGATRTVEILEECKRQLSRVPR